MPAKRITELPDIESGLGSVDLYEVEKSEYDLPYAMCLREPLKSECEYLGYAFSFHLLSEVDTSGVEFEKLNYRTSSYTASKVLEVQYYKYKVSCSRGYHAIDDTTYLRRTVYNNEFAAGPYFALMFTPKPEEPAICISDIMSQPDLLYSALDVTLSEAGQELLQPAKLALNYFRSQTILADIQTLGVSLPGMSSIAAMGHKVYMHDDLINTILNTTKDAYLNIVHDCNRYCAISSVGLSPSAGRLFPVVEHDGLRCVHALLTLSDSETYKDERMSMLRESKGLPHKRRGTKRDINCGAYAARARASLSSMNKTTLLDAVRQLSVMQHNEADALHNDVSPALIVGCVLPAIVGSAIVYVMRSNSKIAQGIRNTASSVISTMRGMKRVSTLYTAERNTQASETCIEET